MASKLDNMREQLRDELITHLKCVVSQRSIEERSLSDKEIEQVFNYSEWANQTEKILRSYLLNVDDQLLNSLTQKLSQFEHLILSKVKLDPLQKRGKPITLSISMEKHVKLNMDKIKMRTNGPELHLTEKCREIAKEETKIFLSLAKSYLDQLIDAAYEDFHIHKTIDIIFEAIDKFEAQDLGGTFTDEYRVDLILEIAGYALQMFKTRQEEELSNYMESLKDTFLEMFKLSYKSVDQMKSAAICLASYVIGKFSSSLQNVVALALVREMNYKREFASKSVLRANILMKLLEKENFYYYRIYLTDVSACYLYWIRELIYEHCNSNFMYRLANNALDALVSRVKQAASTSLSLENKEIEKWFGHFRDILSGSLVLNFNELQSLVEMNHNGDLFFFTQEFLKALEHHLDSYLDKNPRITSVSVWDSTDPAIELHNRLTGCSKQCPFCKEQCEYSAYHGGDHRCFSHRPQGLGSFHHTDTKEMIIEICEDLVGCNNREFHPIGTCGRLVSTCRYRDAGGEYSNWYIPGRRGATPDPYWKWFTVRFRYDLTSYFGFKTNNIPYDWHYATKDDARRSVYKLL